MSTTMIHERAESGVLPGPRSLPIPTISRILAMIRLMNEPIDLLRTHHARYGELSGLVAFKPQRAGVVMAFGPRYNQQVLSDPTLFYAIDAQKALGDNALARLSAGLVNINGDKHKQHRRLMMPAFHRKAVEGYADDMIALTRTMLDSWTPGQTIDITAELRRLVLHIITRALFGMETMAENQRLGRLVWDWTRMLGSPANQLLPHRRQRLMRLSEQLEAEFKAVIAEKRAQPAEGTDVLSMLIAARDEDGTALNDVDLIGHLAILFIAGHETTVNAVGWALVMLACYPHIQAAVVEELDGILHGDAPTTAQIAELGLLDRILKETLRLFPAIVYTLRSATAPFEMDGYTFQDKTVVFLSHFLTHRMPDLYTQPERFMPERWEQINPSPYEYIPFSAGPRLCIGTAFASMEMRIVLAMLLQRYRLSLPHGAQVDYEMVSSLLQPKPPLMTVNQQDRWTGTTEITGKVRELIEL